MAVESPNELHKFCIRYLKIAFATAVVLSYLDDTCISKSP